MAFAELIGLERHDEETFVGSSPAYPWGGVYGGQLVAQALRAACETIDERLQPHVLHASYVRAARPVDPITFAVDRVRDGARFATRGVTARQAARTVVTMIVGFHAGEPPAAAGPLAPPAVGPPDDLPSGGWSEAFECRYVPHETPGHVTAWLRLHEPAGDDPVLAACALAYLADDVPGDAALELLPAAQGGWRQQSLDHNVWFHRPPAGDGWQLQDFCCQGVASGRGLVVGQVFDRGGAHLATVGHEVLLRRGFDARP